MSGSLAQPSPLLTPQSPSFWAAVLSAIIGVTTIVLAVVIAMKGTTTVPLYSAMAVVGLVECAVAFYCIRRVRVAWAFALSLNGACFVTLFFGGPRIRDAMGWPATVGETINGIMVSSVNYSSLLKALAPCAVFGLIVFLYALRPEDF